LARGHSIDFSRQLNGLRRAPLPKAISRFAQRVERPEKLRFYAADPAR
jgi:hypothetical protein